MEAGARALPITAEHGEVTRNLPMHHPDPLDRLLAAQAMVEHAVLISG